MRVILAALFVVGGSALAAFVIFTLLEPLPPLLALFLGAILTSLVFLVLTFAAQNLFNLPPIIVRVQKTHFPSLEKQIADLEQQDLLVAVDFRATRAFKVGESEDEGPHYFLELENGNILYMNGQYLYDYEQYDEDDAEESDEILPAGQFPCTNFTVRRHCDKGHVVDILCRGSLLSVEEVNVGPKKADRFWRLIPADGDILIGVSFDALRDLLR